MLSHYSTGATEKSARMARDLQILTVEELARLAHRYELIDEFHCEDGLVLLKLGNLELVFAREDAKPFLRGLLQSRLRTLQEHLKHYRDDL